MIEIINDNINSENKVFKSCYDCGIIVLELQHNDASFRFLYFLQAG